MRGKSRLSRRSLFGQVPPHLQLKKERAGVEETGESERMACDGVRGEGEISRAELEGNKWRQPPLNPA